MAKNRRKNEFCFVVRAVQFCQNLLLNAIPVFNSLIKTASVPALSTIAPIVRFSTKVHIITYATQQKRLTQRYGILPTTAVGSWSAETQRIFDHVAKSDGVRFALTSGTTSTPKRIPYSQKRLTAIKRANFKGLVQAAKYFRLGCPTAFVLSGLERDSSLSSFLLWEKPSTSWVEGLVMPSRYLMDPAVIPLLEREGTNAVRLCLMVLSNPTVLYATNPSTILVFLEAIEHDWMNSRNLLRQLLEAPDRLDQGARSVLLKAATFGWRDRAQKAISVTKMPDLRQILPGLKCYCCWDGGYVMPFLDAVRRRLLPEYYRFLPMYSMSTECIQTQVYFEGGEPRYLPIAKGVLYEFLPEEDTGGPERLVPPSELEIGACYNMVISDQYGFRRYRTDDIFRCVGKVHQLPDLRFVRRRGLTYSFTGEKLTGGQAEAAFLKVREMFPALRDAGAQMTLIPANLDESGKGNSAHYRLVVAHTANTRPGLSTKQLSAAIDSTLQGLNIEFAAKRRSGRLGDTKAVVTNYDRVARLLCHCEITTKREWETQFKLSPLFSKTWSELGLPSLEDL